MPLSIILVVIHTSNILPISLNEFYLVFDRFFQLLVVEVVLHELINIGDWDIFFDVLCRIHIAGKLGGKSIPKEWEIVVFVIVECELQSTVIVYLVLIIHNLVVVWIMHGVGRRGSGFICQPVLLGSTFDPANGWCMLPLFDCQIGDGSINVSGIGESNGRQLPFSGLVLA